MLAHCREAYRPQQERHACRSIVGQGRPLPAGRQAELRQASPDGAVEGEPIKVPRGGQFEEAPRTVGSPIWPDDDVDDARARVESHGVRHRAIGHQTQIRLLGQLQGLHRQNGLGAHHREVRRAVGPELQTLRQAGVVVVRACDDQVRPAGPCDVEADEGARPRGVAAGHRFARQRQRRAASAEAAAGEGLAGQHPAPGCREASSAHRRRLLGSHHLLNPVVAALLLREHQGAAGAAAQGHADLDGVPAPERDVEDGARMGAIGDGDRQLRGRHLGHPWGPPVTALGPCTPPPCSSHNLLP
mmetsp:Transcript_62446/g.203793  ORF Transcript_62446/g.203793 Transcript_62446/m.203793 type:complete len:301 (-) Transcript_62446:100-1002(-)